MLDALFADGFADLADVFTRLPETDDAIQGVLDLAVPVVEYCVAHPARYHLMFQRTIPGFQPTQESHSVALVALGALIVCPEAAGITDPADIALIIGLISGLAAEQTANDPKGRLFAEQTRRGIRTLVMAALTPSV